MVEIAARQQGTDRPGCNVQLFQFRANGVRAAGAVRCPGEKNDPNHRGGRQPEEMADHRDDAKDHKKNEQSFHTAAALPRY